MLIMTHRKGVGGWVGGRGGGLKYLGFMCMTKSDTSTAAVLSK